MAGLPFKPSPEQRTKMPLFSEGKLPRYLFRLHTATTAGKSDDNNVTAPTCLENHAHLDDIFQWETETAANRLSEHLSWDYYHEKDCNLMSWSCSLLFLLQYAAFRHGSRIKKRTEYRNMHLIVLDTATLPGASELFVNDLDIMTVFASSNEKLSKFRDLRRRPDYYYGEYLSQGDLRIAGHARRVSVQDLHDHGLLDIFPSLKKYEDEWAKRVNKFRQPWARMELDQRPRSIRKVVTLAQSCFGDRWALPLALSLLSCQCLDWEEDVQDKDGILKPIRAMFDDEEIREALQPCEIDSGRMPELQMFEGMVRALAPLPRANTSAAKPDRDPKDLMTESMASLSLNNPPHHGIKCVSLGKTLTATSSLPAVT